MTQWPVSNHGVGFDMIWSPMGPSGVKQLRNCIKHVLTLHKYITDLHRRKSCKAIKPRKVRLWKGR